MEGTIPPPWLAYPGSAIRLALEVPETGKLVLRVVGNPQGLASLAGTLLWLQSFSDHGAMSLSALQFVTPQGALALAVVIADDDSGYQGRLVRVDRDRQFELRISDERLSQLAIQVHALATNPEHVGYSDAAVSPDSDALLRFEADVGSSSHDDAR